MKSQLKKYMNLNDKLKCLNLEIKMNMKLR